MNKPIVTFPQSAVFLSAVLAALSLSGIPALGGESRASFKFDFGSGKAAHGYMPMTPTNFYSKERSYGFEPGARMTAVDYGGWLSGPRRDFITSEKPFLFSVAVPEGNYRVKVTFGDRKFASTNTAKAELRRLMLEDVRTARGKFETRTFLVNVRTPGITADREVQLKDRERTLEFAAWDDKLTLEFNGARPCVAALEIERADDVPTVYLLGDSTVCDQPTEPWNSWGQMLTRFFKPKVAIANHAESGESIRSSLNAGRFDKVYGLMKRGDYLILQFGHNDMKSTAPNALQTYESDLKEIVTKVRALGGTPVLVTSMERKNGIERNTLADYPETVRQVAREDNVALIDLHAMSKVLYRALGPNLDKAFQDGTHHNNYGSYELAKCIVEGIRQNKLPLARFIVDDFRVFDPAHPDPAEQFNVPASPLGTGN